MASREFKVLVNYTRNGVSVAQSLYTGPHRKHADRAFQNAGALGKHGILRDCTVTFFDGYRIREDLTKTFDGREPEPFTSPIEDMRRAALEATAAKEPAGNFHAGDTVTWVDPDGGLCTQTFVIRTIEYIEDDFIRIEHDNGELECPIDELIK